MLLISENQAIVSYRSVFEWVLLTVGLVSGEDNLITHHFKVDLVICIQMHEASHGTDTGWGFALH